MSRRPPRSTASRPVSVNRVEALSHSSSASTSSIRSQSQVRNDPTDDRDPEERSASINVGASPLPGVDMTDSTKLFEALCKAQAQVSAYETEIIGLKAKLADLTMAVGTVDRARGCVQDVIDDSADKDFIDDVAKWGRHFGLFYSFIVLPADFREKPVVSFHSLHPDRFRPENRDFGTTLELYECLPQKYHDLVKLENKSKKTYFSSVFLDGVQSSRSTTLTAMRQKIVPAVFESRIPNSLSVFATTYNRTTVDQIKQLLGETHPDRNGTIQYPRLPPILYHKLDTSRVSGRFRNEDLFSIARGVIFGVTSVNKPEKAVARTKSVYVRSEKRPEATFGLIACICILTRMVFSTDTILDVTGCGNVTKTNYLADFNFYKYTLASQAASSDPATREYIRILLAEWNQHVFGAQHRRYDANAPDSPSDSNDPHARDAQQIADDTNQLRMEAASDFTDETATNQREPESHSFGLPDNYPHAEVEDGQYNNYGSYGQDEADYWEQIQAERVWLNEVREAERADGIAVFPTHASFPPHSVGLSLDNLVTPDPVNGPTTIPGNINITGAQRAQPFHPTPSHPAPSHPAPSENHPAAPSLNQPVAPSNQPAAAPSQPPPPQPAPSLPRPTRRTTRENTGKQKGKAVRNANIEDTTDRAEVDVGAAAAAQRPLRATAARTKRGKGADI